MSFTSGVSEALNNTKGETEVGIGGFRLFARVNESTTYSSIVPVDVLEDGSNATDDIINNAIKVSIKGVVGDLFEEPQNYPELISGDYSSIGEVVSLLPAKSQQQAQRVSQIDEQLESATLLAERAERIGTNAYEFFNNSASTAKSQQAQFVEYMEAIHFSRVPVSLSTNHKDYTNMALSTLVIAEDSKTGDLNFSADFIEVSYSSLIYVEVSESYSSPSSAVSGKTTEVTNQGGQTPETNTESSLLGSLIGE